MNSGQLAAIHVCVNRAVCTGAPYLAERWSHLEAVCFSLRQDLEANSPRSIWHSLLLFRRWSAAAPCRHNTHTGRNHDVRHKLCPLDQQAAFADVHLLSTRPYSIVLNNIVCQLRHYDINSSGAANKLLLWNNNRLQLQKNRWSDLKMVLSPLQYCKFVFIYIYVCVILWIYSLISWQ